MDDQNELIATADEESSENEEQSLPPDNPTDPRRHTVIYEEQTKTQFVLLKISLIFLSLAVFITFPIYVEANDAHGNTFSLLLISTILSLLVLILITTGLRLLVTKYKQLCLWQLPVKVKKFVVISMIYFVATIFITDAVDKKKVACHLQDPLKGLVLVFSLLFYFFFCRRLMCLQKIFSITGIIVGLFVALDYNLCNEFKCRGFERKRVSDDTGNLPRHIHAIYTSFYIVGLALFAGYFTILEHTFNSVSEMLRNRTIPFLSTVSSSAPTVSASSLTGDETEQTIEYKKVNAFHFAMWLHVIALMCVIVTNLTEFIPQAVQVLNSTVFWSHELNGIKCHFSIQDDCHNLALIVWLFVFVYVGFVVVSIQFLILTQSAVYTVATISTALPLTGICWSLFQLAPLDEGFFFWGPTFSGELISSLLGLPIIIVGQYFLYKSHEKDCQWTGSLRTSGLSTSHVS